MKSELSTVEKLFHIFQTAYASQNYGLACDALFEAVTLYPNIGFRYFITRASGQITLSLHYTRRAAELATSLDGLLDDHPDMHLLVDYDPDLIRRIVDLRESNIAKGLPSIAVVTQGKSASVSVAAIFNSGYNLPSFAYSLTILEVIESWARDYARGGACYCTHLDPSASNTFRLKRAGVTKIIVHVRDPRESLLSMIHHVTKYPDQLAVPSKDNFRERNISAQISTLMEFYISRIQWIQGWMDAESHLDLLFSTFRDFVHDRDAFIERSLEYYGAPREHFSYQNATTLHEGTDYHFRAGLLNEWRSVFPPRDAELLTACLPAEMKKRFGWDD